MSYLTVKLLSSLEKCFLDEHPDTKTETRSFPLFRGERLAFQLAIHHDGTETRNAMVEVVPEGDLAPYIRVREVVSVPSALTYRPQCYDEHYLRTRPGLYPDLLRPLSYGGRILPRAGQTLTLFFSAELPESLSAGEHTLTLTLRSETGEELAKIAPRVVLSDRRLPPQRLIHTEWFYTDCLANYYGVSVFSEAHWQAIENFMALAAASGINMILTPIFTPELDTYVGGQRLTTQLLDIEVADDGTYSFGFDRLDRWLALCRKVGIDYLEFPHFFTQWGAEHAPKILAKVGGEEKQLFGWDTDALGWEYRTFLSAMIPALLDHLAELGIAKERCYFHVSDEPKLGHLAHYTACKDMIAPYLRGCPILDALSDYAFYETGALTTPAPATKHIRPFLEHKVPGLWAYYCGANGSKDVSNRFFAMSLARVRIIGVQLYLYNIVGFLHWGYNFYNNRLSYDAIDPFLCTDGDGLAPSGDTFLVYPGADHTPWESLRLNAMREAMDDIRALQLCESVRGREFTEALILDGTDGLTFDRYPTDPEYLLRLRAKIKKAVEDA